MAAIRAASAPYSRSPISASPDSFRRTRPNAACPFCDSGLLLSHLEAHEATDDHVLVGGRGHLRPQLLDCLGLVLLLVDVLLVEEHDLLEPLPHPALGDLLLDLLRLAVAGRLLAEDAHLALAVLLRDVLLGHVEWCGGRHVEGDLAGEFLELVAASHEVGLAVDLHEDADLAAGVHVAGDDALAGDLSAPLCGLSLTLDAQDLLGLFEVALRLLESGRDVHDAGPRSAAELLHILGRHQVSSSGSKVRRSRGAAAAGIGVAGSSGEKPASSASRRARSSASRRSCSSASLRARSSASRRSCSSRSSRARSSSWRKRADFSATSPAIASITTLQERIASSLPGTMKLTGSGSQLESTSPMIGIFKRAASRTAISSVFRSTTNIASGPRWRLRTPPRLVSSLSRSLIAPIRSRVGSSSMVPLSVHSVSSCSLLIRLLIVWKLVRSPPSQR